MCYENKKDAMMDNIVIVSLLFVSSRIPVVSSLSAYATYITVEMYYFVFHLISTTPLSLSLGKR